MTNGEIAAALKADIQEIEARIAHMKAIADAPFRDMVPNRYRKPVEAAVGILELHAKHVHDLMYEAAQYHEDGDVTVQSGGGK